MGPFAVQCFKKRKINLENLEKGKEKQFSRKNRKILEKLFEMTMFLIKIVFFCIFLN